jgi:hypothetical protein
MLLRHVLLGLALAALLLTAGCTACGGKHCCGGPVGTVSSAPPCCGPGGPGPGGPPPGFVGP